MCAADGRSSTARRTSSCSKRYASPRPGSSTSRPLRTASSSAPTSSASPLFDARRTVSSSKSAPITAASSSASFASAESRARRRSTPSRTVVGTPRAAAARASRAPCGPISTASEATSSRHSSVTRNALPPVSSPIAAVSSVDASAPVVSLTNSRMSSGDNPPSRIRATPSVRYTSTSASASSAGTSASASRNVATSSILASAPERTRWRMSCRLDVSAQWTSSSTRSTGDSALTATRRSVTAVWSLCRSVSPSAAAGCGSSPMRDSRSGSRRVSSPAPDPRSARRAAGSSSRTRWSSAAANGP